MKHRIRIASMIALAILFGSAPAFAQIDLTGEWGARQQEDQPHRNPGPELGDYSGFPINQAARQKADAWDASILSQPERQTQPHPAQYSLRGGGGPNLHFAKIYNPLDRTPCALDAEPLRARGPHHLAGRTPHLQLPSTPGTASPQASGKATRSSSPPRT
jgi:hypothetical protein